MPYKSKSVPVSYVKLNGGLNTTSGPLGLQDNESPDLQNIDFDKWGSFKQRNGYRALNTSTLDSGQQFEGLFWFETPSLRKPIAVCNTKVYRMDNLDGTWDDITGAETITADKHFDFEKQHS